MKCDNCGQQKHPMLFQKKERDKAAHLKRTCTKCKAPHRNHTPRSQATAAWRSSFKNIFPGPSSLR
jgi:protein-arginine kinase activator protein McsA